MRRRLHAPLRHQSPSQPSTPKLQTRLTSTSKLQYRPLRSMSSSSSSFNTYDSFGSFHTPSTASLFAQKSSLEKKCPTDFSSGISLQLADNSVAKTANRSLFTLDLKTWTYLNHGAFGAPTTVAIKAATYWRNQADTQPLNFHDRELFLLVVQVIKSLAKFIGVAQPETLVLLPNATAGLHSVLTSVLRQGNHQEKKEKEKDPTVVLFSTRYGAVRKMLQALETKLNAVQVHEQLLSLDESLDDEKVLEALEKALDDMRAAGRRVSLVVVDHVTSNTAVVMPVKSIVQYCHARDGGIPVLVDGAHGLLNLPLNLDELGADYYVGNCHKWFCSARGAGFLHVATTRDGPLIEPRVVSHGFFDGMQSAFMWTGLQDYSAWLALPQCLAFWQQQGVDETREYMHTLAQDAAELLYTRWQMPDHLARERRFPQHKRHAMRLVELPNSRRLCGGVTVSADNPNATSLDAKRVQDSLHYNHHIEVPVKCVDGRLYVRLSAHVYNCLEDYEKLAGAAVKTDQKFVETD